jgi:hypothetical protein
MNPGSSSASSWTPGTPISIVSPRYAIVSILPGCIGTPCVTSLAPEQPDGGRRIRRPVRPNAARLEDQLGAPLLEVPYRLADRVDVVRILTLPKSEARARRSFFVMTGPNLSSMRP